MIWKYISPYTKTGYIFLEHKKMSNISKGAHSWKSLEEIPWHRKEVNILALLLY